MTIDNKKVESYLPWFDGKSARQIRARRYYLSKVCAIELLHFQCAYELYKYENK
ncbi:hypothetical protein [Vibrio sp. M250220]|uniref:hypothetical protein n=1 Tax=Vibrio sp. M250220 TaxID=3020894 RepID=UPI002F40FA29